MFGIPEKKFGIDSRNFPPLGPWSKEMTSAPFDDPLDRILMEIAIRVQLPPSKYDLACQRYLAVAEYVERSGSPLKDKINRFYPQGSMAIGATIAARRKDEEYDIDIVAELTFPLGSDPEEVLDILFDAIRGEPGSRYYNMVKRRTRCVTIYYADGMHMDITPAILRPNRLQRTSDIFHDDPDEKSETPYTLLMNAWGFIQVYKHNTADTTAFADAYAKNTRAFDIRVEAETEDVDPQEDPARKSSDTVALQLLKRMRNTKYSRRDLRMPPSIYLSKCVSDAAAPAASLTDAVLHHAKNIRGRLVEADKRGQLVHEVNPTCEEDCFTDRWPETRADQRIFIHDLDELVSTLTRLRRGDHSMKDMMDALSDIFGETPVKAAVRAVQDHVGTATQRGQTRHRVGGGILLGTPSIGRSAPTSTNMGGKLPSR